MNRLILGVLPCVLAACSTPSAVTTASTPTPASTAQAPVPALSHEAILTKLESPWDMAFLPDGTMFFTEKCHGLSVRQPGGTVVKLVGMKDVKGYSANANCRRGCSRAPS